MFANKGLDAINLSNILHQNSVKRSVSTNHFIYLYPIATKIFNYKHVLKSLSIDDYKSKPSDCTCERNTFKYNLTGHVINGDLNIVDNISLRNVFVNGPKFREPQSINWKFNFKILMDSVEDYAGHWARRKGEELDILSEWVRAVRSLIQVRIHKFKRSMNTHAKSVFKDPSVPRHLSEVHDKYVVFPADKAPYNIVFLSKSHYIDCLIKE